VFWEDEITMFCRHQIGKNVCFKEFLHDQGIDGNKIVKSFVENMFQSYILLMFQWEYMFLVTMFRFGYVYV